MEKIPQSIEEALDQIQTEARARGLLRLTSIYGGLFSKEKLLEALELYSLNVEKASEYLQDNLPDISEPKAQEPSEETVDLVLDTKKVDLAEHNQIQGPNTGKIALEFSLSSQYINSEVPVYYIVDEILKEIFSFLNPWERGRLASVCKTWKMIDETTGYLYKKDCLVLWTKTKRPDVNIFHFPFTRTEDLWGEEYPKAYSDSPEYIKSFKSWKNMWLKRPRIRFNGIYISRVVYFKQGQVNIDNLPSYHKIVFYRYLKFYSDFSVCCLNTTKKPREYLRLVDKNNPDARLGEWARVADKLKIHLLAKNEIFTYSFNMKSSSPHMHDVLKLLKVETRNASNPEYSHLNIDNDAWPKYFKFINIQY
jgi:F-box only protein C-terminal region/F-box-like